MASTNAPMAPWRQAKGADAAAAPWRQVQSADAAAALPAPSAGAPWHWVSAKTAAAALPGPKAAAPWRQVNVSDAAAALPAPFAGVENELNNVATCDPVPKPPAVCACLAEPGASADALSKQEANRSLQGSAFASPEQVPPPPPAHEAPPQVSTPPPPPDDESFQGPSTPPGDEADFQASTLPSADEDKTQCGPSRRTVTQALAEAELRKLKVSELKLRAMRLGVSDDKLDNCLDADVPKDALIQLLQDRVPPPPAHEAPPQVSPPPPPPDDGESSQPAKNDGGESQAEQVVAQMRGATAEQSARDLQHHAHLPAPLLFTTVPTPSKSALKVGTRLVLVTGPYQGSRCSVLHDWGHSVLVQLPDKTELCVQEGDFCLSGDARKRKSSQTAVAPVQEGGVDSLSKRLKASVEGRQDDSKDYSGAKKEPRVSVLPWVSALKKQAYVPFQRVQCFSVSQHRWVNARVSTVTDEGLVTVLYTAPGGQVAKQLPSTSKELRRQPSVTACEESSVAEVAGPKLRQDFEVAGKGKAGRNVAVSWGGA